MSANGVTRTSDWDDAGELPAWDRLPSELRQIIAFAPFRLSAQAVERQWILRGCPAPGTARFEVFLEDSRVIFERQMHNIVRQFYGTDHPQAKAMYDDEKEIRDGTRVQTRRRGADGSVHSPARP